MLSLRRQISLSLSLTLFPTPFRPSPHLDSLALFLFMWNSKRLQMYFLSGVDSAQRPCLLCKSGLKERMVMTVALWDYKRVKFKRSQHIRAPVNQAGPSARVLQAPECLADVCVYSCPRCSRVCACARVCVLARARERCGNGRIKGSGSLVQCRTFSASFLLFCPLLTRQREAKYEQPGFGHEMQRCDAASLNKGGEKKDVCYKPMSHFIETGRRVSAFSGMFCTTACFAANQ